ncbi:hypothetical protein D9615_009975 [Tricholomella constricta]|uniref:Carbonic anhydrase n=1 Tax=Tricholomella constricta TaxID=117010 RepID=A0A8H5GR07_9AGAR|nr:hypothetical protein D9615_009975 [Tricholomella constricta]
MLSFNVDGDEPGTLFTSGNVTNQFHEHDLNSKAVLAYAVDVLKIKRVIVMGHYGCGGVAAATLPVPESEVDNLGPVQDWIAPIRGIYDTSERPEIVRHRKTHKIKVELESKEQWAREVAAPPPPQPHLHDPAFRALVEENVKANVQRIARSAVISNVRPIPSHTHTPTHRSLALLHTH